MTIQQANRTDPAPKPQAATAYVSLYAPSGRRTQWWYAYSCRTCGRYQLGRRPRLEDVAGLRRGGCGHEITVVIARIYGRPA